MRLIGIKWGKLIMTALLAGSAVAAIWGPLFPPLWHTSKGSVEGTEAIILAQNSCQTVVTGGSVHQVCPEDGSFSSEIRPGDGGLLSQPGVGIMDTLSGEPKFSGGEGEVLSYWLREDGCIQVIYRDRGAEVVCPTDR